MLNKAILIGRVGRDPDMRTTGSGAVARLSVATSERYRDKRNGGEIVEKTEWHTVTAFGRLAEIVGEYVHKGALVYVDGKIETRKYEKDGVERYATGIVASELRILSLRGERRGGQAPEDPDIPF